MEVQAAFHIASFAKLKENEEAIFIFDDSILRGVTSGFVLTDKYLYHKELPGGRISLTKIEEMHFNSGFLKAIVVITTDGQEHELSYNTAIDGKSGLMDFLTTVILYINEHPDSVLHGKKEKDKEINDEKKLIDNIKAIRRMPGVFLEVEKRIINSAKRKCDDKGLITGKRNTLMFKGISQDFDSVYKRMLNTGSYVKPDNIEVPLMLFYKEADFTGGFIITSEAVYNSSSVIKNGFRFPIKKVKEVKKEEFTSNATVFIYDSGSTINLCKVPVEEGNKYLTIIRSFIEELSEANDEIVNVIEELYSKVSQIKEECKSIYTMSSNELDILHQQLKEYPEIFSDEMNKVKNRMEIIDFEQYLSETFPKHTDMKKEDVKRLINEIEEKNFNSELIMHISDSLSSRLLALETEELEALCGSISTLDKAKLLELTDTLMNNYSDSEVRKNYLSDMKKRVREIEKAEIKNLCKDIDNLTWQEGNALREKLRHYDVILTKDYLDQIAMLIDRRENEELSKLCDDYDNKDRTQLITLINEINNLGFKESNTKSYITKLHSRIVAIDKETINNLCPDINQLDFKTGYQRLSQVAQMDIVDEVKNAFMDDLDTYLIQLKMNEMAKYMKWLMDSGSLNENLGIPYSSSEAINNKYIAAATRYARNIGKYEIPILFHDTTMFGSGEEGFIITNYNIYFKGKMTQETVIPLYEVSRFEMEKKMLGFNVNLILVNGYTVTIPNKINKDALPNVLAILNQLLFDMSQKVNRNTNRGYINNNNQMQNQSNGLFCSKCGSVYTAGQKFCTACGNHLDTPNLQ